MSDYLNQNRSIEELNTLIELHREAAEKLNAAGDKRLIAMSHHRMISGFSRANKGRFRPRDEGRLAIIGAEFRSHLGNVGLELSKESLQTGRTHAIQGRIS